MEKKEFFEKVLEIIEEKKKKAIYLEIESFRQRRIGELCKKATKFPFVDGPKLVLHLIPLDSLRPSYDFKPLDYLTKYKPDREWNLNLDGFSQSTPPGPAKECEFYTQVYRNGVVESVDNRAFDRDEKRIKGVIFATDMMETVNQYLALQRELGIAIPIILYPSLLGVAGFRMSSLPEGRVFDKNPVIDRNDLIFPGTAINKFSIAHEDLKPILDHIWNACGHQECFYFDGNGKWKKE